MRRIFGAIALWMLVGVLPAHADYFKAEVDSRTPLPNGLVEFNIRFLGNSGETTVVKSYVMVPASTAQETYRNLRLWCDSVVRQLNLSKLAANVAVLQPNQDIPLLAPTPPTPPAETAWRQKVNIYDMTCTKGFLGNVATDCAALKTNIESTYQAGFLQ